MDSKERNIIIVASFLAYLFLHRIFCDLKAVLMDLA